MSNRAIKGIKTHIKNLYYNDDYEDIEDIGITCFMYESQDERLKLVKTIIDNSLDSETIMIYNYFLKHLKKIAERKTKYYHKFQSVMNCLNNK